MSVKVKICGITNLEDARYCAARGADYLGFILYEQSPRYIDAKSAAQIIEWVHGPIPVGIFVNATADYVNRMTDEAGFEMVQLHGYEPSFEIEAVERPVIKTLHVSSETTEEDLRLRFQEYEDVADYFLLDTYTRHQLGGTGRSFDWSVAAPVMHEYKTFLAGGLNADNVGQAIQMLRPYAVDVSSSLEEAPGKKDFAKIDGFMASLEAARARIDSEG